MEPSDGIVPTAIIIIVAFAMAALMGCTTLQPTCRDNPNNMSCMSADEINKRLGQ